MIVSWGLGVARLAIPVDPDAPDARQWLRDELAKPPYQAAQPTWFDRVSQAILDWFMSLSFTGDGSGGWLPVIGTLVVVAVVVAAVLIFGVPRRARRRRLTLGLFAADDRRTAAQMRAAAAAAATSGDWALACEEAFRALAQDLADRTIVRPTPGTTAHRVAELAADAFPAEGDRLRAGAVVFESVRYLGGSGTETGYRALVALDSDLRAARPRMPVPTS